LRAGSAKSGECFLQLSFSRARFTDQTYSAALLNCEINVVDGINYSVIRVIFDRKISYLEEGFT
jgi:hypothetical protein